MNNNLATQQQANQQNNCAYIYDGSLEGLLCAIFDSYERHEHPSDTCIAKNLQPRLGQAVHEVKTDLGRASRVRDRIATVCGPDTWHALRAASLSDNPTAGTACMAFAHFALDKNRARWKDASAKRFDATQAIVAPQVAPLHEIERSVWNERHYMVQFLRFEELEGGVWFAKCHPKASVVPLLMDYFTARFNTQPFIVYDERHQLAGVYEGNWSLTHALGSGEALAQRNYTPDDKAPNWYLVQSSQIQLPQRTENEEVMRRAWKRFYQVLSVDERYNPELRRQFMPMRFWGDLTEFQID